MTTEHEGGGASRTTEPAGGSSSATDVSLREHIGMQIAYERRGVWMLCGFGVALGTFGWSQIQRRLENLNHENARISAVTDNTVSSDTYDSDKSRTDDERDKLDTWRASVDEKFTKAITRDDLSRETKGDRQIVTGQLLALLGVVAVAAGAVGHYLFH